MDWFVRASKFTLIISMDPFKVLGLPSDSSDKDIKSTYLKLAKEFHPDVNRSPNAADKFKAINSAFEMISTKEKLTSYRQSNYDSSSFERRPDDWKTKNSPYETISMECTPLSFLDSLSYPLYCLPVC